MWTVDAHETPTADAARARREVPVVVLLGPDGAVYCLPEHRLAACRVHDRVAAELRDAYDAPTPDPNAFVVLARGPLVTDAPARTQVPG